MCPELHARAQSIQSKLYLLDELPPVLSHHDFSEINILVDRDSGGLTGVVDFDEAQIEAFGMCIFGLYECFFGAMEKGRWSWYEDRQRLEGAFCGALWDNLPPSMKQEELQDALSVAIDVGMIQRYFIRGMLDEYNETNKVHVMSLEYARALLLR